MPIPLAPRRGVLAAVCLAALFGCAAPALGQDAAQPQASASAPQTVDAPVPQAPVIVDGEVLFVVRGVSAYPAEQRAADIADRIRALARDPAVDPASLTLVDEARTTFVVANGRRIFAVLDEDAAVEAIDRRLLAELYRGKVSAAITAYRSARQPGVLVRHSFLALGATLLMFIAAYGLRRVIRGLNAGVERRYRERVRGVSIQSFQVVRSEQLWRALSGTLHFVWVISVAVMGVVYLRYVLGLFPWTRSAANQLVAIVTDPLRSMALGLVRMFPNFVFLAILFLVVRYFLKLVRLFFDAVGAGTVRLAGFDREWASPTYKLARLLVIVFAIVVAFPYVPGSDSDAFRGVSLFIGIVFSLGSSSIIGNMISGFGMTYRRTFRIGDMVKIGEHMGQVLETRLLVTHLRTAKNVEVIVPNSNILTTDVLNYTTWAAERGLILNTTVAINYSVPWRQVEAMLLEAAAQTPGLLNDRAPFVLQRALGDFGVTYELNAYCDTPMRQLVLYAELHRNILDVFNKYGVQIMVPAYEGDPAEPKVVTPEKWYAEPARPTPPTPQPPAPKP